MTDDKLDELIRNWEQWENRDPTPMRFKMFKAIIEDYRKLRDEVDRLESERDNCQSCSALMDELDMYSDALQKTHRIMGGSGEWSCKIPNEPPPPDSGDLCRDVPALASDLKEALARVTAERDEARKKLQLQINDECEADTAIRNIANCYVPGNWAWGDKYAVPGLVEVVNKLVDTLKAERDEYRKALQRIREWDCMNPPNPDVCCDHPWLRRLLDDILDKGVCT